MNITDSVDELKNTELYKYLTKIEGKYAKNIEIFVLQIAPILATTKLYFPYYTRHDAHHSLRVCLRISQIIKPECLQVDDEISFTAAEVFLLIAASYVHDLGMTVFPNEEDSLCTQLGINKNGSWSTNPKLQSYLRSNHSNRGGSYINEHCNRLGVPKNLVAPLNDLMRSHNLSITQLEFEFKERTAAQEKEICIKQLAIILCIADALEFSDTRVVAGVLESLESVCRDTTVVSYMENMKHVCIGDSVAIGNDGRVIFSGTFDEPDVLSLAHNTIDNIEEWVRGYCDIDRNSHKKRLRIIPQEFSRNLTIIGADFERLGIRINKDNIINLIASNSIWKSDLGISVKELLQNSVEACRFRAYNTPEAKKYEPIITVNFDRENNLISVSDNGCGMSKHTILNNFLTVGNSRSKEMSYSSNGYDSLARFGIGFWSIFTIAKKAIVETAPFESLSHSDDVNISVNGCIFDISIGKLKDYTLFREQPLACGTRITLHLKDDIVIDDVYEQLKKHIICSEIDINFNIDQNLERLLNVPPKIDDRQLFGSKLRLKDKFSINTYEWRGREKDTALEIKFAYRMENGHATFMLNDQSSLLAATDNLFNVSRVGVCGFNIPLRPANICFDLSRIGAFIANKQSPKGFDFSIDRQQLLDSPTSKNYSLEISELIHKAYRCFLQDTNSYSPSYIYNLNMQSTMHGGNVYDQYTGDELKIAHDRYPDLLCFKLYKVDKSIDFKSITPLYIDLKTLMKMKGTIWLNQNSYSTNTQIYSPGAYYRAEDLSSIVFECAQSQLGPKQEHYVIEANRPASMLFDNDPESTVEFIKTRLPFSFCFQKISIENIKPDLVNGDIYEGVRGTWAGTIYMKEFRTPNNHPFIFLGRHRVLIRKESKLSKTVIDLYGQNRHLKLANIIKLLNEAEQGFVSDELNDLL